MSGIVHVFFLTYAALFPIINPLGDALVFLNLTGSTTLQVRRVLAWRIAAGGFLLLACSVFIGSYILAFFGISLAAVRIAGGTLTTALGWRLLHGGGYAGDHAAHDGSQDAQNAREALDLAFFPLTWPLTFGPGSITVAIALGNQQPYLLRNFGSATLQDLAVVAGLLAICTTVYLAYRHVEGLKRVLGQTGTSALARLSAFAELCIGIQIIWQGMADLIRSLPR